MSNTFAGYTAEQLRAIRNGASGPEMLKLQYALIEGKFMDIRLPSGKASADGKVGPFTLAAIQRALDSMDESPLYLDHTIPDHVALYDKFSDAVMTFWDGLLYVRERPGTKNRGREIDVFHAYMNRDPKLEDAYCAQAVCTIWWIGATMIGKRIDAARLDGSVADLVEKGWRVITLDDYLKGERPGRGYAVARRASKNGRFEHVECFDSMAPNLDIATYGANTKTSGSREGDGIYKKAKFLNLHDEAFGGFIAPPVYA